MHFVVPSKNQCCHYCSLFSSWSSTQTDWSLWSPSLFETKAVLIIIKLDGKDWRRGGGSGSILPSFHMSVSVLGLSDHPNRVSRIFAGSDLTVGQEQGSPQCALQSIFHLVSNPRWWLGGSSEPDVWAAVSLGWMNDWHQVGLEETVKDHVMLCYRWSETPNQLRGLTASQW